MDEGVDVLGSAVLEVNAGFEHAEREEELDGSGWVQRSGGIAVREGYGGLLWKFQMEASANLHSTQDPSRKYLAQNIGIEIEKK